MYLIEIYTLISNWVVIRAKLNGTRPEWPNFIFSEFAKERNRTAFFEQI